MGNGVRLFASKPAKETVMLYPMFVRHQPFGGLSGEFPDFPGCLPEGDTMDELMDNVQDTVLLWMKESGISSLPAPSHPETTESECPPLFVDIRLPSKQPHEL